MNQIPHTAMRVSPVTLGTMTYGSPVPFERAVELTRYAVSRGINHIDTANMYEGYRRVAGSTGGVAEEIVGEALRALPRDQVIVSTKAGMKVGSSPEDEGTSAAAIHTQLDRSLRRMGLDYVDLFYLHRPDESVRPDCAFTPALREIVIELKGLADELTALGYGRHVQFDLGKIAHLDYYTGIIFEGFIEGAGTSVLSGGRYDQLLKVFGNDLPACGFSFKLDALIDHIEAPEKRAKVRLIYGPRQKVEAMQLARDLRREQIVELVPGFTDEIIIKEVEA